VELVFSSVREVLAPNGAASLIDLCRHGFEVLRGEMGDVHLEFDLGYVKEAASRYFSHRLPAALKGVD